MNVSVHATLSGGPIDTGSLSGLPRELAFSLEEFQERLRGVRLGMREHGVDALLVHHPSNVYYLSGYQSIAMYNSECVVLPLEHEPSLIVHPPELGGAILHSWFERLFGYAPHTSREHFTAKLLADQGLDRARIGVEKRSPAVSAGFYQSLQAELPGAELVDGSGLVDTLKVTKSPKEIEYIREAAQMTNLGMRAAIEAAGSGTTDNDVAAAAYHAMVQAGSEYVSLGPIVTSGRRSGILHSTHKRVPISGGDPILLEMGACYHRYTGPLMRSVSIGEPATEVKSLVDACLAGLSNVLATIRPGVTADEVARAGWEGIAQAGPDLVFHGNFGYAVGASFPPAWGDDTAAIELGIQTRLKPGMVFHHPVSLRRLGRYGAAFSETSVVTEQGCEVLTDVERRMFVR